jgi:hypothetical protein
VPVRPRPPAQAISTRSVAARCQASVNVGRTSARSAGKRKSGQRSHRDSQETSGGDWPSKYTPKAGLGPSGSGRLRPRPRTSLPEGSRRTPGAEGSQNSPTADGTSRSGPHIAGRAGWKVKRKPSPALHGLLFVFVRRVRTQAPPSRPSLIPPDGMGQGTEPVEVHAVEGADRKTHHTLLLFALPVVRTRSYRYAKNSVSFFSVVAHCSTSRFLKLPVSQLAPQQHAATVRVKQAAQGTTRLAELQYLLRYCGLKQACFDCLRSRVAANAATAEPRVSPRPKR